MKINPYEYDQLGEEVLNDYEQWLEELDSDNRA